LDLRSLLSDAFKNESESQDPHKVLCERRRLRKDLEKHAFATGDEGNHLGTSSHLEGNEWGIVKPRFKNPGQVDYFDWEHRVW
jgi:hypothetical protein